MWWGLNNLMIELCPGSQAVSLSALAKADVMQVPKPLHLGKLPK